MPIFEDFFKLFQTSVSLHIPGIHLARKIEERVEKVKKNRKTYGNSETDFRKFFCPLSGRYPCCSSTKS